MNNKASRTKLSIKQAIQIWLYMTIVKKTSNSLLCKVLIKFQI